MLYIYIYIYIGYEITPSGYSRRWIYTGGGIYGGRRRVVAIGRVELADSAYRERGYGEMVIWGRVAIGDIFEGGGVTGGRVLMMQIQ